jgi:hypothetical protein
MGSFQYARIENAAHILYFGIICASMYSGTECRTLFYSGIISARAYSVTECRAPILLDNFTKAYFV